MKLEEIRNLCIDRTWDRALNYLSEGKVEEVEKGNGRIEAKVQGTKLYTIKITEDRQQCSCPYSGRGKCKHIISVLLDVFVDEELCLTCNHFKDGVCETTDVDGELITERDAMVYPTDHCLWFE